MTGQRVAKAVPILALFMISPLAYAQSGWQSQDIGATAAGSTNISNGVFTIMGNGADIYGTADAFRYVYLQADGDCEIQARVVSTNATNAWCKAGVMIRQSLTADSAHAHMNWNLGQGYEFQYRPAQGSATSNIGTLNQPQTLPRWVRLRRTGNAFSGYYAADSGGQPGTWQKLGTDASITMTGTVYVGLSALSHENNVLRQFVFDNVVTTGTQKTGAGILIGQIRPSPSVVAKPAAAGFQVSFFRPDDLKAWIDGRLTFVPRLLARGRND